MKKRSDFENDRRRTGDTDFRRREPARPENESRDREGAHDQRGRPRGEDSRDRDDRPYGRRSRGENRFSSDSQSREPRSFGNSGDSRRKPDERSFSREDSRDRDDRPYARRPRGENRFSSDDQSKDSRDFGKSSGSRRKPDERPSRGEYDRGQTRSKDREREPRSFQDRPDRSRSDRESDRPRFSDEKRRPFRDEKEPRQRGRSSGDEGRFSEGKNPRSGRFDRGDKRDEGQAFQSREDRFQRRPEKSAERFSETRSARREKHEEKEEGFRRTSDRKPRPDYDNRDSERKASKSRNSGEDGQIRLNRFIANAGICSRREADELIEAGQITVNGKVVNEMGFKVGPADVVKYGKRILNAEKLVYILLNKPKDYITTTDDPEDRRTVLQLIEGACEERVYPVGRLDRNTTGLLLITNDGELADKLTHPSHNIKKVYQAELDKPITLEDFEALKNGIELEDGFVKPDDIGIVTPDAFVVGIEIHSGRNRIVRRMFEHFGYDVKKLDRTTFAGLNKKDLPRGEWRFLTKKEVITLKFLV